MEILSYALTQIALIVLTVRDPLFHESRAQRWMAGLSWVALGAVALIRALIMDDVMTTMLGLAGVGLVVLIATWWRPALIMSDLFDENEMSRAERTRGRIAQGVVIVGIVVLAAVLLL